MKFNDFNALRVLCRKKSDFPNINIGHQKVQNFETIQLLFYNKCQAPARVRQQLNDLFGHNKNLLNFSRVFADKN